MRRRSATEVNAVSLHRVIRSCIDYLPRRAAVKGRGYVEMPDAGERFIVRRASRCRSEEGHCRTIVISRDDCGKGDCLNAGQRANVENIFPVRAAIV